jgi:hypothetical protein
VGSFSWSDIEIPFKHTNPQDVYSGKKTATRRTDTYGAERGKRMGAVFPTYRIVDLLIVAVYDQKLGDMDEEDAKREGYESLDAFKKAWAQIHPRRGWDPEQTVWVIEWRKPN